MTDTATEIARILENNAFEKHSVIARMLALSEREVSETIRRLEDEKIILGYKAIVNREKAFDETVFAVIEAHVTPERDEGFDAIAQRIYRFPEVRSLYLFSGNYDFLIFVEGKNLKEIAHFVAMKLSTVAGVKSTASHFMLKTYKENGIAIDDASSNERLKVSP